MKLKPFASILAAIALAGGTIVTRPQPSAAQSNQYFCAESADGVFTTFAQIPNGDRIPVMELKVRSLNVMAVPRITTII